MCLRFASPAVKRVGSGVWQVHPCRPRVDEARFKAPSPSVPAPSADTSCRWMATKEISFALAKRRSAQPRLEPYEVADNETADICTRCVPPSERTPSCSPARSQLVVVPVPFLRLSLKMCALFVVTIVSSAVAMTVRTNCRNLAVSTVAALAANRTSLSRISNLVARK